MASNTDMDWGGLDLIVNSVKVGATAPGQAGTQLDSTHLGFLSGVTAGTASASKALVLGASSEIATITSATITTLTSTTVGATTVNVTTHNVGASGTAGTVSIFPTTASKGKVTVTTADNSGNTTTNLNFAAQAGSRTYTVPDAGASGKVVVGGGNAAVTLSGTSGTSTGTMTTLSAQVTSGSITTAGGATHVATITYTGVASTDMVFITKAGGSNSATENYSYKAVCSTDTITVTLTNQTASTSLNGTVIFNILVIKT